MFEFLRKWISTVIENTKTDVSVDFQLLYLWDTKHGFSIQSFIYLSNLCIFIFFHPPDSEPSVLNSFDYYFWWRHSENREYC